MKKIYYIIFFALFLTNLFVFDGFSQDIESTLKKIKGLKSLPKKTLEAGIKASGSISSNSTYFSSKVMINRRVPFESILNGNVNFDFFGKIKMPFTFAFNSQNINFTHPFDKKYRFQQPFNHFQFKPTYKGLSVLMGINTMTFSPLTLSGHRFEGLGITFKPSKFPLYGNFMMGVLQKSVLPDTSLQTRNNQPAFKRNGLGIHVGYKLKKNALEVAFFKAKDEINSVNFNIDKYRIKPQENIALSINGNTAIGKKIAFKAEWAVSGLTEDQRTPVPDGEVYTSLKRFGGLLLVNRSTIYKQAIKTAFTYSAKTFNTGIDYNRIDPQYKTLGAYFFTNDLENINLNFSSQMMEGKLAIVTKVGRQRDNLDNAKSQSLSQWVGSGSVAYNPSEAFNMNLSYSNFTSFTNLRTELEYLTTIVPYNALDTLNYRQISQSFQADLMKVFNPESKDIKKSIVANAMYQQSFDQQASLKTGSNIANLNTQYTVANKPKSLNWGAGVNIARNDFLIANDWLIGPTANLSKGFFKQQLKTNVNLSLLQSQKSNKETSQVFNGRFACNYTFQKTHTFLLNMMVMNRKVQEIRAIDKDIWDFTANLSYSHNFKLLDTSKKKPKNEKQ